MSNYNTLKAQIAAVIHTNGVEAITGQILQDVLLDIVDTLGDGFSLVGVATTTTTPTTPDGKTAYIAASAGTYTYFLDANSSPLVVPANALSALFTYDPSAGYWVATSYGVLANGVVDTAQLADGAVTLAKINASAFDANPTPYSSNIVTSNGVWNYGQGIFSALNSALQNYVKIADAQTITGQKTFSAGLKTGSIASDGDININAVGDVNIGASHLDVSAGSAYLDTDIATSGDITTAGTVYVNGSNEVATKSYVDTQDATKQDVIADIATIRTGAALGATAYQLPANGVPTADIEDGAVTAAKIADGNVTLAKIDAAAIDDAPTANSDNLVTSGGVALMIDKSLYAEQYFTIEMLASGTITFSVNNLQYSTDNGATWETLTAGTATPTINAGGKVLFKQTGLTPTSSNGIGTFSATGDFNISGNVMSLLFGDSFATQTSLSGYGYAFYHLFRDSSHLKSAENLILPATTLSVSCYQRIFTGSSIITPPSVLPAETLPPDCYRQMFYNCTALKKTPEIKVKDAGALSCYFMFSGCSALTTSCELLATTTANYCFYSMFMNCPALTTAPSILPATTLATSCYHNMFNNTAITTAPELPAETLAETCYKQMFKSCSHLNYIKCLATDITATDCTDDWTDGVASSGAFVKADTMTSWTTGIDGIPSGWTTSIQADESAYVISGATAERPQTALVGLMYFDTTIGKPIWWNGSQWVDATGASV